jgi:hypothetical protein
MDMPIDKPPTKAEGFLSKVGFGFTPLDNEAINVIGDAIALAVWVHLCSKPQAWRVSEKEVCNSLSIGRDRYRKAMTSLRTIGLVWDDWTRHNGRIIGRTVNVTWTMAHARPAAKEGEKSLKPEDQAYSNYLKPDLQSVCNTDCKYSSTLIENKESTEKKERALKKETPVNVENQGIQPSKSPNRKIQKTTKNEVPFERFWEMWPKKTSKKAAEKAWLKIKDQSATLALIATNLEMQANSGNWTNPQYIPNPATYLNGENWNDTVYQRQEPKPRHGGIADTLSIDF